MRCVFLGLMLIAMWPTPGCGAGPQFDVRLRDGRQTTGTLTDELANGFQIQSPATGATSLNNVLYLELPQVPHPLPDRSWKRLTLINGDVLHATPVSPFENLTPDPSLTRLRWEAGFETPVQLPVWAISQISHPTGTHCVVYHDFETDAAGWVNQSRGNIPRNQEQARSGTHSLKCTATVPELHYALPDPLDKGWLEFSFFLPAELSGDSRCVADIQITDKQQQYDLQMNLAAASKWYELNLPELGIWQQHIVARRPGWHTFAMAIEPGLIRLKVDNFPLAEGRLPSDASPRLSAVNVISKQPSANVWIDDFAITRRMETPCIDVLDRQQDQVNLVSGDQLFGKLINLGRGTVSLQMNSQPTEVTWADIAHLRFAASPTTSSPAVAGQIVQLELQPWTDTSREPILDSLTGSLVAISPHGCTLEHPLGGQLQIPWAKVRRLRPFFFGLLWSLEGRPFHLGDQVKSALQPKIPDTTLMTRVIDINTLPVGIAHVALTAVDLEPAGQGTLDHPWLKRVQAGELTSELWVNGRRIRDLNSAVTGRGTARQPQQIRIELAPGTLQRGQNRLEIRLKPSRNEPVVYDNWELQDWRLEFATSPEILALPEKQ